MFEGRALIDQLYAEYMKKHPKAKYSVAMKWVSKEIRKVLKKEKKGKGSRK